MLWYNEVIYYKGSVHEIKIDQLLLVQIASGNVLEHIGEQRRHILAQRHSHDSLLDGLFALPGILRDQAGAQLERFTLARRGERLLDAVNRHDCDGNGATTTGWRVSRDWDRDQDRDRDRRWDRKKGTGLDGQQKR